VPVISPNVGGIPELIEQSVSGYLWEPDDAESLSQAILTCHGMNENDRRQMSLAARMKIEIDHDVRKLTTVLKRDWAGAGGLVTVQKACAE